MIGETISHYRITGKLGAGGMGIVYKALDLELQRPVALKFLPHDLALSESDRERFLREARSASALDHPNIGVIHGIDKTADGRLFIVMAYYEGQTLAQKLAPGPLPLGQAMNWACQIAAGLGAAHARNIVHRDIKPSNILITLDNSARIVDFGLARVVATPSATLTGGTTGTLPYMSPEQVLGETVDQRCDVWALSILLVQMLTGSHPFARDNSTAMTFAILNQAPAAIDALPALLQPVVLRGLAKEPAHRYPNAREILSDLEAARAQLASPGRPSDDRTLTGSGHAQAVEAALREIATHASTPRWQAPAPPAKRRAAPYLATALAVALLLAGALFFPAVRQKAAGMLLGGGERHVAVLPFDNLGRDPANQALAEGLMDSLTGKLSNLDLPQQPLWVVPASVVRSRKIDDPAAAGRELGATLVVKGSIQRDGQKVRLTVNLIDVRRLRQIGSASLDDASGDLAVLQDEAVARLARLMNVHVTAEMLRATGGRASPAAYELYLKALGWMQRYDKPGNLDQAVEALNTAVKADPKFALGFASLGEAYRLKNLMDPNPRWTAEAAANGRLAVQLDDALATGYVTLGRIHEDAGQHDLAVGEFQRAIQLDPRNAEAHDGMAHAQESAGHPADAEETFKKAAALRPDNWSGYNSLALFYDRQGRYADAVREVQRAIELTPDNSVLYLNLGAFYLDTGEAKFRPDAEQALKKSIALTPSYPAYANLGIMYCDAKRFRECADTTERALQLNDTNYLVWGNLVLAYDWLGETARAATACAKAIPLLEQTVKAKPRESLAHSTLGEWYGRSGERQKAQGEIRTALALSPDDPAVLESVGAAYAHLGDLARAAEHVKKAVAKGQPVEKVKGDPALRALWKDPTFRLDGK